MANSNPHADAAVVAKYREDHPTCESERCFGDTDQIHHLWQGNGSRRDVQEGLLALCPDCHREYHGHSVECRLRGFRAKLRAGGLHWAMLSRIAGTDDRPRCVGAWVMDPKIRAYCAEVDRKGRSHIMWERTRLILERSWLGWEHVAEQLRAVAAENPPTAEWRCVIVAPAYDPPPFVEIDGLRAECVDTTRHEGWEYRVRRKSDA